MIYLASKGVVAPGVLRCIMECRWKLNVNLMCLYNIPIISI